MNGFDDFNEEHRFGSGRFAARSEIEAAGLLRGSGLQHGFLGEEALGIETDASTISICGAGSGKTRDLLGYVVCGRDPGPMLINDPRGELAAISLHRLAPQGVHGYYFNPVGIAGLPQHSCNILDILRLDDPAFHTNCKFISDGLIPVPPSAKEPYFGMRAREWVTCLIKDLVEHDGNASLPALYHTINLIEGDGDAWANRLERMLQSQFPDVRRCASEILNKQTDSPREFGSITGEIYAHTSFLADPALCAALEGGDFSLADLVRSDLTCRVHLNIPAEYMGIWSGVIKIFFIVAMLFKSRSPQARRVNLVIDECGQLGNFDAILRAVTFGRGAGIRCWTLWQDVGQIRRNLGESAVASLIGSSQVRQFYGVRDYETAKLVSDMLGQQTLSFDDHRYQEEARRYRLDVLRNAFGGGDPFARAFEFHHYGEAASRKSKQTRFVCTPDEILSMPEDQQILFVSGMNLKPVRANKYAYFKRPEMAGKYLNNPYHGPSDKVQVMSPYGPEWLRIIEAPVPDEYSHFPQYQSGRMRYVEHFPI